MEGDRQETQENMYIFAVCCSQKINEEERVFTVLLDQRVV
jgi:hypothetical protein